MVMDPRTVAVHEAGHAVLQWFVGWEDVLEFVQMRRVDGGATDGGTKVTPPPLSSYSDIRVARKRLLMLLAGGATADDINARHDRGDWENMQFVFGGFFRAPFLQIVGPESVHLKDEKQDAFLQDVIAKCNEIVRDARVRRAIEALAGKLLRADPDGDGVGRLSKDDVVRICEQECGGLRNDNPWSAWLAGE